MFQKAQKNDKTLTENNPVIPFLLNLAVTLLIIMTQAELHRIKNLNRTDSVTILIIVFIIIINIVVHL
jgi:hypothetical protein